ncbi:MAG: NADH:ubiquinone reductase (Na(+)-transporting) subunit D [Spirochaetales bacterium]|nr:NADH:ubiquinone reductase (Na(+)-transporting) subunit D [Spirochaetales bacterium]
MGSQGLLKSRTAKTILDGIWRDHPVFSMLLGICSALAVSNRVANAIAMGASLTFVLVSTAIIISSLRKMIPNRIRMITYMITIASFVIIVDRFLKAFFPGISESIGPYVGLIITNCIVMGRAEAFFIQNNPYYSVLDALSNGFAYTYTLVIISVVREILGFGTLLGVNVIPAAWLDSWWQNWVVMAMAPGAFFLLAVFIWISRTLAKIETKDMG